MNSTELVDEMAGKDAVAMQARSQTYRTLDLDNDILSRIYALVFDGKSDQGPLGEGTSGEEGDGDEGLHFDRYG